MLSYIHTNSNYNPVQPRMSLKLVITVMVLMLSDFRHHNPLNKNPIGLHVVLLSEDISASPLCPCNYFGACICFNMSLANEQRQGMLQASSSWLTCIWHNVPCADRCRVAVWSSGLYHGKRIRHDWCCGKADSMNYEGLIRSCWKWFILLRNMVIRPHLPPWLQGPYCVLPLS